MPITVSILITAYREANTIGRALDAIISQLDSLEAEIIVICPDDETAQVAFAYPHIRIVRDNNEGKPAALNLGLKASNGEIIIMTDGDVYISSTSLAPLMAPFSDPAVGAVSGKPISLSPRNTMLGYWSHLLTDAGAHREREIRDAAGQFMVCSGYLYAIRAGLIDHIPFDALAEDAVVSHQIALQGYQIRYASDAFVYVKYPTTYRDWLKQRVRSAGGYAQKYISDSPMRMRSFRHEVIYGTWRALRYPQNAQELFWTLILFLARLHLWLLILWQVRIRRTPLTTLWQRVESTK